VCLARLGEAGGMTSEPAVYPGQHFLAEITHYAVWLYHVFSSAYAMWS
jgi:hypothetical protein